MHRTRSLLRCTSAARPRILGPAPALAPRLLTARNTSSSSSSSSSSGGGTSSSADPSGAPPHAHPQRAPRPTRPTRSLAGRVAIVTGAGAQGDGIGNGRAAAILLAEAGCAVVCADAREEAAQETVAMIERDGDDDGDGMTRGTRQAISIAADVTSERDCQRVADAALARFGRLDILVNNVGVLGPPGDAVAVDMAAFARAFDVNVASMVRMAKACVPAMRRNLDPNNHHHDDDAGDEGGQQWCAGSIVNLGSIAGLRGGGPDLAYCASKGAVVNLTRAMAAQHAADRIRVNCVCPGMVYTPMVYGGPAGMTEAARRARRERSLLRTEGSGWDVGAGVRFLAGDEARWITGVVLPIDAGATAAVGIGVSGLYASARREPAPGSGN